MSHRRSFVDSHASSRVASQHLVARHAEPRGALDPSKHCVADADAVGEHFCPVPLPSSTPRDGIATLGYGREVAVSCSGGILRWTLTIAFRTISSPAVSRSAARTLRTAKRVRFPNRVAIIRSPPRSLSRTPTIAAGKSRVRTQRLFRLASIDIYRKGIRVLRTPSLAILRTTY